MSLTGITDELSKSFDACLETILADPQQKEEDAESRICCLNKLWHPSYHHFRSGHTVSRFKELISEDREST